MRRGTGGGRSLTFNGHIDVVPATPEHHWTLRPVGRRDRRRAHVRPRRGGHEGRRRGDARRGPRAARRRAARRHPRRDRDRGGVHGQRRRRLPRARAAAPTPRSSPSRSTTPRWSRRSACCGRRSRSRARPRTPSAPTRRTTPSLKALPGDRGASRRWRPRSTTDAAAAPELQRRRRPRGRLGVVGPGGVRARGAPGGRSRARISTAVKARFEAAVDARVEWRGFHAHGFEIDPRRAALRRPRPRPRARPRRAAGAPRVHRHDRRARVRRPRRHARHVLRPDRRATCTRPTSGSTSRASRTRRSCSRWRPRSGAARAPTTVTPSWANEPIEATSSPTSSSAIVFATSSPGRTDAAGDRAQHPVVVADGHAVDAEDAQLVRDHARHRHRDGPLVAEQQPDLHVAAALAQALDRVHARRRAARARRSTRARRRRSASRIAATDVVATRPPPRPARARAPACASSMSTATTRAPAAAAIITAASPTPPQPWTATHSPARTRACTCSAAHAVMKRQPSDAASTSLSSVGHPRRGSGPRAAARRTRANEPQTVKPGWKSRSQICVSPSRHGSHDAAAAAERHGHAVAGRPAAHRRARPRRPRRTARARRTCGSTIDGSWPIHACQSLRQTPVARPRRRRRRRGRPGSSTVSIANGSSKARITAARIAL